jgi:DNA-directed RNA polymerase subunit RPC12/RpoP
MKNWQCSKCTALVQEDNRPTVFNCPKGSSHNWTDLGNVGSKSWQCSKCAALVKSDSRPSVFNCPQGSSHNWTQL